MLSRPLRPSRCLDLQPYAEFLLKSAQNSKEVSGARVSFRAQHSMQTFAGNLYKCRQPLETNGGIDKILQNRFAQGFVTAEISVECFRQQSFTESAIALSARVCCLLKVSRQTNSFPHYFDLSFRFLYAAQAS